MTNYLTGSPKNQNSEVLGYPNQKQSKAVVTGLHRIAGLSSIVHPCVLKQKKWKIFRARIAYKAQIQQYVSYP
jgi:hypothetical protein